MADGSAVAGLEAAVLSLTESPVHALLLVGVGALIEGPVVTIVAAALAGAGHLPWWGVWIAATIADVVGDTVLLTVGKWGKHPRIVRLMTLLGLTEERRATWTRRVLDRFPQVVMSAKLVDVAAVPAYLAAGLAGVTYHRFLCWIVPASAVRAGLLVGLGYAAGNSLLTAFGAHPSLVALGGLLLGVGVLITRSVIVRLTSHGARR